METVSSQENNNSNLNYKSKSLEEKLLGSKVNFLCNLRIIFHDHKLTVEEKYSAIQKLDKQYAKLDLQIIKENKT
ncbi:MAG: hypothetical protein ABI763_01050 [Bacteroidota bacterium]